MFDAGRKLSERCSESPPLLHRISHGCLPMAVNLLMCFPIVLHFWFLPEMKDLKNGNLPQVTGLIILEIVEVVADACDV